MRTLKEVVMCGAKNSTILRSLNEAFSIVTYGFDTINPKTGIYYDFEENFERELIPEDVFSNEDYLPRCYYFNQFSLGAVKALKAYFAV